jgi:hypothetical protein
MYTADRPKVCQTKITNGEKSKTNQGVRVINDCATHAEEFTDEKQTV